ncbi:MAG: hypothetical protein AB7O56_15650 [Bauldia sp.]
MFSIERGLILVAALARRPERVVAPAEAAPHTGEDAAARPRLVLLRGGADGRARAEVMEERRVAGR